MPGGAVMDTENAALDRIEAPVTFKAYMMYVYHPRAALVAATDASHPQVRFRRVRRYLLRLRFGLHQRCYRLEGLHPAHRR